MNELKQNLKQTQQGNNSLIMKLGKDFTSFVSSLISPIFVTVHYNVSSVSRFGIKMRIIFSLPHFTLL